ncbi:cysteine proteinase inhibitor 4 [Phtheirospermum japonicum]|uniref:Cysteine proteinase inhibitor 4 n=1 Tax=Phtheirospermum japonicum TaxID=374723 RepID=A0A830CWD7_9LAMI|nr:cysteine proteinase inhibitor 4 [Phtheirospermum japonicum]
MALKLLSPLMIFSLLLNISNAFGGRVVPAPSPDAADAPAPLPNSDFDYDQLNTKSDQVIAIAKFVIDQINKVRNTNLVYSSVFEALAKGDASGTKYDLVIAATDLNNDLRDYQAVVLSDNNASKIILFKEIQ